MRPVTVAIVAVEDFSPFHFSVPCIMFSEKAATKKKVSDYYKEQSEEGADIAIKSVAEYLPKQNDGGDFYGIAPYFSCYILFEEDQANHLIKKFIQLFK